MQVIWKNSYENLGICFLLGGSPKAERIQKYNNIKKIGKFEEKGNGKKVINLMEEDNMNNDLKSFSSSEKKEFVQNIRNLLSHSRVAFLLGAGCSKIAGLPLMQDLTQKVIERKDLNAEVKTIISEVKNAFFGAATATIEDYMSEIVDFLSIAERRSWVGSEQAKILIGDKSKDAEEIKKALGEIKNAIVSIIYEIDINLSTHQKFIKTIHGSLEAGKRRRRIDYFVLNYDTLIEDSLALERVVYSDGFLGGATGWWDPKTYDNSKNNARVFKIHGSIDWCNLENENLPIRIRDGIKSCSEKKNILIYPSATKYQETQKDPFAQIIEFFRKSLYPQDDKETVLAICGYSFGDSHINLEIENALYRSEGSLTIAAFVSWDEPKGKLKEWLEDPAIFEQVQVYSNKGFFHGEKAVYFEEETPWWKFEIFTSLLGGEQ